MSQIDWSVAPSWATHVLTTGPCWDGSSTVTGRLEFAKLEGDTYRDEDGAGFSIGDACWVVVEERPGQWNGEGLPAAGTVCEWKEKSGCRWVKATVLFVTEQSIVLQRADGFEWQIDPRRLAFRPFRTPEQIAAQEREDAILAIAEVIGHQVGVVTFLTPRETAEKLYDAGYRKQVAP